MRPNGRIILLYCCLLGIEGCGLYLILDLLNIKTVDNTLSVFGLLALYPISFIINKAVYQLRWYRFFLFILSWLLWAIAFLLMIKFQLFAGTSFLTTEWLTAFPSAVSQIFVAFKPEILIFVTSILLWWTGRRMTRLDTTYGTSVTEFQFWLFIIIIILLSASGFQIELHNAILTALCFFFFSLAGISIAHTLEGKSWLSGLPRGYWTTMLLISIIVVLIVGIAIASLLTPNLLHFIVDWVLWILSFIWDLFMKFMAWLASLIPPLDPGQLPPTGQAPAMAAPDEKLPFELPETVRIILETLWLIFVGGLIIVALWGIAKEIFEHFLRRMNTQGAQKTRLHGAFRQDLINMLRYLWQSIRKLFTGWRSTNDTDTANSGITLTRQIYRNLLRWAARHHCPRRSAQTPQEFYEMLAALLPDAQAELATVTHHYINVRYGLSPPAPKEQERLRRSWITIKKKHLRAPKAANKEVHDNGQTAINNG